MLVNGTDVRKMAQRSFARNRLCPAKASIFSGTIKDNIRFGKEDATDEEIWKHLKRHRLPSL
ncbi:hypothetical protein PO124_18855 [Bacillus licheniformis]|nr:hypothetical protein [Bacillus licheniformis]